MSRTVEPAKALMFGYTRVSTEEQAESRNGLEAQAAAIDAAAECRKWAVEHFSDEGKSGKYVNEGLREVLGLLASGQGDGLVVTKLDRLARSVIHASEIIERANEQGWSLVVLDMNLDLTTASGRMIARSLMNFAEYERELIGERTRDALAAKKRRGESVGRPRLAPPGVVRRIVMDRNAGLSYQRIANALTTEGILSPAGRPTWQSSTVRRIFQSATATRESEAVPA